MEPLSNFFGYPLVCFSIYFTVGFGITFDRKALERPKLLAAFVAFLNSIVLGIVLTLYLVAVPTIRADSVRIVPLALIFKP